MAFHSKIGFDKTFQNMVIVEVTFINLTQEQNPTILKTSRLWSIKP